MWSGSLNFGLVTIPVRLHAAVRDRGIHFHQVDTRDRSRVRYKIVNEHTGEEVDREHLGKCYQVAPDECVIITQKELKAAAPEASRAIELQTFVDLSEIDPVYFERPYYLVPEPHAAKAYALLVEAMHKSSRIGIGRFVMRGTEYLAAIRPRENVLCLETMRFADEVVAIDEVPVPERIGKVSDAELKAAQRLIDALTTEFNPEQYPAEHRERLRQVIDAKAHGGEIALPRAEEGRAAAPRTLRLVEALKASLEESSRKTQPHHRARAETHARRKRSA
jgi:DNA end-binding protein Ku